MTGIHQNRIKIHQLRALVAVAEYGNFSEAALQLSISQSTVSHAIASLEDELGVLLLVRGRNGAQLTPAGEDAIAYARQVLQLLDHMVEQANLHKGLQGGQVRVAAFRSAAEHLLPEIFAQFRTKFPQINVTLTECYDTWDVERALRAGKADIGFTNLPTSDDFESWEILHDEYIALLPPTAKIDGSHITWEQLAAYPLIAEAPGNACYVRLRNYLETCGIVLNVAYELKEDATRIRMVAQGLGAAILPRLAAKPIPADVQVYQLPVPLARIVSISILLDALHSPAVYAFRDMVKETLKKPSLAILNSSIR
jgi:DNA-binding transcriptional LysR family regulator